MLLKELLEGIYNDQLSDSFQEIDVYHLGSDSRKMEKNGLFVAVKGSSFNGVDFIDQAISKGARVVVTADDALLQDPQEDVCYLSVEDPNTFLKQAAQKFYDNPSEKIKTIGITGTNGKTTIAYIVESIIQETGTGCGVIGTINYRVGQRAQPSTNTTPGLLDNQKLLNEMVQEGLDYCVMEVSSHALDQNRIELIDFHTAVFTNLTSDHLDYHETMQNYFQAKSKLFVDLSHEAHAVINVDDVYGRKLISKTQANVLTYGIDNNADVTAQDIEMNISGTQFKLSAPDGEVVIRTRLIGIYNVYNILAAVSVCLLEGINLDKIKSAVEHLPLVPGRLESIDCQQDYSIFIDYAHTQDALENVLKTIRQISDAKIILVFGCGGDRDKTKRPAMGKVASQLADYSIVTSDNPRSEDPGAIIEQIVEGFVNENYEIALDREEAIYKALNLASSGDIVLIAGKGHETYQVFKDTTIRFDEHQIIRQRLRC